jgi:general secretion pathway protein D
VIAEVGLTDLQVSGLESFGIDFKKPAAGLITPGTYNVSSSTPSLGDSGSPALSMQTSLKDFSLSAVLNKAKEDRNVKILSSPTIVTTHNHRASINVGEARPIITSSTSNLNNSDLATRSTVEYRDIGITLRVRPLIGDNNVVQMEIEQIVETVVDTQTIDNNIQPIIGTRRATSFVSIKDQETLIMAGLQSVESSDSKGKVYLLGSIPIVGKLFSPKSKKETTRELIIFIKPIVVQQEKVQGNKSLQEDIRSEMLKRDVQEFLGREEAP